MLQNELNLEKKKLHDFEQNISELKVFREVRSSAFKRHFCFYLKFSAPYINF